MMKHTGLLFFYISISLSVFCNDTNDSLTDVLNAAIDQRSVFFNIKNARISNIYTEFAQSKHKTDGEVTYTYYERLFNEYESFIYDSAFKYAMNLKEVSLRLVDNPKIARSKLRLGFVLMSSGLFKEAVDTLKSINLHSLNSSLKAEYYATLARSYYDLADYDHDSYYSLQYRTTGNNAIEEASKLAPENSLDYWLYESLHRMKSNDIPGAAESFERILSKFKPDEHQKAIATSSLGYIYTLQANNEKAIEMLLQASIADIHASTKETVALRNLSGLLYKQGDIKTAYRYIKIALEDATFYNARHRKIEIATILPIIEGEKLNTVERQKTLLAGYSVLISILSIVVIIFLFIIFRQLKRLKIAKQMIQDTNNSLTESNHKILEANKIKDEYIGYFFNTNSEYIDKIEKFQRDVNRKLATNQIEDIKNVIRNIDLKKEREELYHSFDKIFLKLFPDFVKEFNSLFNEEDRIVLKDNQLLNSDLRIFALIRMGISDNEKIAKILEYSVNTIYTYKTKIKNKSLVANDAFEERIMAIKSV